MSKEQNISETVSVRPGIGIAVLAAVWFGLTAGLIEVGIVSIKRLFVFPIRLSRDVVWMAPLAEVVVCLVAALGIYLLAKLFRRKQLLTGVIFVSALIAFFDLFLMVPRLHHYAAFILAAGFAVQATRWISNHQQTFLKVVRQSVHWIVLIVFILGVGLHGWLWFQEKRALGRIPAAASYLPNIILITLDTVRAHNLSVYGYHRKTTPNLEKLAAKGVVFEQALSTASWTLSSHASLFTGRYPFEMGVDWRVPLDNQYPTLAEYLRGRGYRTAGFISNTGYCSYESGLSRGFVHYEDYRITLGEIAASSTLLKTIADNFRLRRLIQNDQHLNRQPADVVNHKVLKWLSANKEKPFFMFINYYDAHEPYLPPPPYDKMYGPGRKHGKYSPLHHWNWDPSVGHNNMNEENIREEIDAYDGALTYLDHELGIFFQKLEEMNLSENTLIVLTADHGEEFGEHGVFDHGNSLYLPSLHVPLIITFPGRIPMGVRISRPVSLKDIPATIVELVDSSAAPPFPGPSLAQLWRQPIDTATTTGTPLLAEVNHATGHPAWFPVSKGNMKSVFYNNLCYIKNGDNTEELYNFLEDPWEKHDLAQQAEMQSHLVEFRGLLREILHGKRTASPDKP